MSGRWIAGHDFRGSSSMASVATLGRSSSVGTGIESPTLGERDMSADSILSNATNSAG